MLSSLLMSFDIYPYGIICLMFQFHLHLLQNILLILFVISSLTYALFRNVLFHFQIFVEFSRYFYDNYF